MTGDPSQFELKVGGAVPLDTGVYIVRQTDSELLDALQKGEYCNVLCPRQMGKTSSIMRIRAELRRTGFRTALIDIAGRLGTPPNADDWYVGLLSQLSSEFRLGCNVRAWWLSSVEPTANQKLLAFFREEVLQRNPNDRFVVFLDEIDHTLNLQYTDDFFLAIRSLYNDRAGEPDLGRLAFCLAGVFTPNELVKQQRTTTYNVGRTFELQDFDPDRDDLTPLARALSPEPKQGKALLVAVLRWTGGQPYLTASACRKLVVAGVDSPAAVDRLIEESFLTHEKPLEDSDGTHFENIARFLGKRVKEQLATVDLYRRLLRDKKERDHPTPPVVALKLSGLVKTGRDAQLTVRNKIYRRRFDDDWAATVAPSPSASWREKAEQILASKSAWPAYGELRTLVKELKGEHDYGTARKLISGFPSAGLAAAEVIWLRQQLALCTYKDEDLLPAKRFKDALTILDSIGLRNPNATDPATIPRNTLPETLALGGAVYKRMFEYNAHLENLHLALTFYRGAWDLDPKEDMGYGGVNAAYVLDLLASVATRTNKASIEAQHLREEAISLRRDMANRLPEFALEKEERQRGAGKAVDRHETQYWYVVTLAEIHFGLGDYPAAAKWLDLALQLGDEWQKQTSFRQLLSLARVQNHELAPMAAAREWSEPWKTLGHFFDEGAEQAFSCWRGKVGLALSGGGFRASLFHLGVLARLAEMDVLRSVEVLSTVSGGSIVGAHYYLEVRNLLRTRDDVKKTATGDEITREDYIQIVKRVQERFLAGVQKNLRTRVLTNLGYNFKMLLPRWLGCQMYTRSHRIGELYEQELYSKVDDGHPPDVPRVMSGLMIQPKGETSAFKPKFSNWRRRSKVPVLLLNATSLNSGHNWQFTASWMGEPPGLLGEEVDLNVRYRRLYYWQAPIERLQNYPLGHAVAASACVPALFEALSIEGLYPSRTVRLVDGGVHDNQGVAGLLDESCTFILCSDAAGQMSDEPSPPSGSLNVALRSNSILMSRVRETQYQDLRARVENHALQGLFFIHLKQDLVAADVDWAKCQDPHHEPPRSNATPYGVDRDIQSKLAAIRTDLDSFTEVEAYALMLSGYLMTKNQFEKLDQQHRQQGGVGTWGGFDVGAPEEPDWPFLKLRNIMAKPPDSSDLRRQNLGKQLEVGSLLDFKLWHLLPRLRVAAVLLAASAQTGLVWLVVATLQETVSLNLGSWTVGKLVLAALLFAGSMVVPVLRWLNPQKTMQGWLVKLIMATVGWAAANIHVRVFDPLYLKLGRLERLLNLPSK